LAGQNGHRKILATQCDISVFTLFFDGQPIVRRRRLFTSAKSPRPQESGSARNALSQPIRHLLEAGAPNPAQACQKHMESMPTSPHVYLGSL
jgi:hypothetical protein